MLPSHTNLHVLLTALVHALRQQSIADSSHSTYASAFRKFQTFLGLMNVSLDHFLSSLQTVQSYTTCYVAWLFCLQDFQVSSITTYLASLQFHISNTFNSSFTIWHPALHRLLQGCTRLQNIEQPLFNRAKLPFSRALILFGQLHVLGPSPMAEAFHAALCFGFMFLLRKSEFLTPPSGTPRLVARFRMTISADNVLFWFGELSIASCAPLPSSTLPDFVSIFILASKADQFGKGATQFFPSDPTATRSMRA
jgi:hypothetical protein